MLLLREGYCRDRGGRLVSMVGRSSAIESPEMVSQCLAHGSLVSIYSIPDLDPPYVTMPPASVRHLMDETGVGVSSGQPKLARLLPPFHLLAEI